MEQIRLADIEACVDPRLAVPRAVELDTPQVAGKYPEAG